MGPSRTALAAAGGERGEITRWLVAWSDGDPQALESLIPLVYAELKGMAGRYLKGERSDHTLQPTALVHELYLRLARLEEVSWQTRAQFFALAAQVMRRLLVDYARYRSFAKRGGSATTLSLTDLGDPAVGDASSLLELDEALTALARADPRKASIVELRFFGGLSVEETAAALGCSRATVIREWRLAKAWLHRELARASG